jgi:hypothetical protein
VVGGDAPRLYNEMGRASADYALTTIYRIFFRVGSPHFIVSKAASIFKTYYSSGELRTAQAEKGHAVLELHGLQDTAPELCERIGGWMERTIELSGGTGVRIVHDQCVNRGQDVCRFEGWWS